MGNQFSVLSPSATTGTSATLTHLQVVAPTNQRVQIYEISVSFNGVDATDTQALVEVLRQTDAGTASAGTLVKMDSGTNETLQTTAQITFTVEPTPGDIILREWVHLQGGYTWRGVITVPGGTRLAVRTTTTTDAAACVARIIGEE